jgi:hypothetical protein
VLIYFPPQEGERSKLLARISWTLYLSLNIIGGATAGALLLHFEGSKSKVGFCFIFFFFRFASFFLKSQKKNPKVLKDYAFTLGLISTIAVVCQWSPQIWKTWRAKAGI